MQASVGLDGVAGQPQLRPNEARRQLNGPRAAAALAGLGLGEMSERQRQDDAIAIRNRREQAGVQRVGGSRSVTSLGQRGAARERRGSSDYHRSNSGERGKMRRGEAARDPALLGSYTGAVHHSPLEVKLARQQRRRNRVLPAVEAEGL
eukprot:SAG11_NODE_422_length_9597_cov_11.289488_6_plen_149_part_00